MEQKINLDERTLKAYINEAINEELNEFWGLSRGEKNAKWGYEWDPNLSSKQNRRNRNVQKALIKQKGYRNHDEYEAGEGHGLNQNPEQEAPQQAQFPSEYPYKSNKQKTGQFQTWFNQNMGGKLIVDGIWGPKTEQAYQQWLSQENGLNESKKLDEAAFKEMVKDTINEILNK